MPQNYLIRQATEEDLPVILQIYQQARTFMAATGNPNQWGKSNPPKAVLVEDIVRRELYIVIREDEICGVFFFSMGEDPTYREIYEGHWRSDAPYGVIHRVASNGAGGVFRAVLAFCRQRCTHLRIDTHRDNKVMQHVVEKAGFRRCGIIYVADGSQRIAYELI